MSNNITKGIQNKLIDITLVGNDFDHNYLNSLIKKAENLVSFKIRYFIVSSTDEKNYLNEAGPYLLIWSK
ncbi:MAG: hypothetical protein ACERKD_22905 [Prolixibacteraceae bacterium]